MSRKEHRLWGLPLAGHKCNHNYRKYIFETLVLSRLSLTSDQSRLTLSNLSRALREVKARRAGKHMQGISRKLPGDRSGTNRSQFQFFVLQGLSRCTRSGIFADMTCESSFHLATYLRHTKSSVELTLEELLPQAHERPAVLHAAMRYSVLSGGKRIRPILCIAAWQACRVTRDLYADVPLALRHAASAIEILHAYTLVHDDLPCMDDDDLRRGKPTTHKAYGVANALLAGDALLSLAFETTGHADLQMPSGCGLTTLELAEASGSRGVVGGQVEDLAVIGHPLTRETVDFIHENKTAKLFRAATRIGARMAQSSAEQLTALSTFGTSLGVAFQVVDDLLDDEEDARRDTPSSKGTSLSCLAVMSRSDARQLAHDLTIRASEALNVFDERARQPLLAIVQYLRSRTE